MFPSSRRGSADHAMGAGGGGGGGVTAAGPALVGSGGTATGLPGPSGSFSYWMRVNVSPPVSSFFSFALSLEVSCTCGEAGS